MIETVNKFTNSSTTIDLAEAEVPYPGRNRAPFYHCMVFQTKEARDAVLKQKVIATKDITMQFERFAHELSTYIATFRFPHRFGAHISATSNELQRTVVDEVRRVLSLPENARIIRASVRTDNSGNHPGRWRHKTPEQALQIILRSVKVVHIKKRLENDTYESLVALYCESPTTDPGRWLLFKEWVAGMPFGNETTGHPVIYNEKIWCAVCHTVDHDTDDCYTADIDMYYGPKPNKAQAEQKAKRDNSRANAPRNRDAKAPPFRTGRREDWNSRDSSSAIRKSGR